MTKKLKNKIALITGASRGIGRATVELFASHGAQVIGCAQSKEKLTELKDELAKKGEKILIKPLDLGISSDIDELFDFIAENTDRLDIVVNAAAVFESAYMEHLSEAHYDRVMGVNLKAPLLICRNAIPYLERAGGGTIVNVSSLSGCFGLEKFEKYGAYNISKYGLWGLTEILAIELKSKNIRVNQVSPSGVDTDMYYATGATSKPPLTPKDVANIIFYLASDDSAPLSGENLKLLG
jgi:NAD(P)-dependent dehydrogenase (short-subunit alcohol dehydrogenase family)